MLFLDVTPGVVLAVFFIIFDVGVIAIADVLLTRLVCALYYRDIHAGRAIDVRSFDIPGVINYLVGNLSSFPNIVTLVIKISIITFVFFINLNINSVDSFKYTPVHRNCTYDFIPSNAEWGAGRRRAVERRGEFTRLGCSRQEGVKVTFYRSVFNLKDGVALLNETDVDVEDGFYSVDDKSLLCLSPSSVRDNQVAPILEVTGCSSLATTSCDNATRVERIITAQRNRSADSSFNISAGTGIIGYGFGSYNDDDVKKGFPEYANPKLYCLQQCVGLGTGCCRDRTSTNCRLIAEPCLLVSRNGTHTLFERWLLENETLGRITLARRHPGPWMNGDIDFGSNRAAVALLDVQTSVNWWEYAGVILTDSFVYRFQPGTFHTKRAVKRTKIPVESIALAILTIAIVFFGAIAVRCTLGRDDRPRFNTVNGLSSILREENFPTGASYREGRGALLGLSRTVEAGLHFGPVYSREHSVARDSSSLRIE